MITTTTYAEFTATGHGKGIALATFNSAKEILRDGEATVSARTSARGQTLSRKVADALIAAGIAERTATGTVRPVIEHATAAAAQQAPTVTVPKQNYRVEIRHANGIETRKSYGSKDVARGHALQGFEATAGGGCTVATVTRRSDGVVLFDGPAGIDFDTAVPDGVEVPQTAADAHAAVLHMRGQARRAASRAVLAVVDANGASGLAARTAEPVANLTTGANRAASARVIPLVTPPAPGMLRGGVIYGRPSRTGPVPANVRVTEFYGQRMGEVVSVRLAARTLRCAVADVDAMCTRLCAAGIMRRTAPGRYRMFTGPGAGTFHVK